ncbi:MAG: T9SS type A sorting domain-containing protein [Bacteroidales bacterium]|nr:T9SS type A sorting domain-containing protein [Bacteroidales bacterium]
MRTFTTPCVALTEEDLPKTWDFESDNVYVNYYNYPSCWMKNNMNQYYPYVYNYDYYAHGGTQSLYFSAPSLIALPPVDVPISSLQLSFWIYGNYPLEVGVMTNPDDASTFVNIATVQGVNGSYTLQEIPFVGYTGEGNFIALRSTSGYPYVDDVTLGYLPECTRPSNVEVTPDLTSATITWGALGSAFTVYFKETSASSYTEITEGITATEEENIYTVTVNDLTHGTSYTFYVESACDEETLASNPVTFNTTCVVITANDLPKTWNFETGNTAGTEQYPLSHCWQRITPADAGTSLYPYVYNYNYYAHGGNKSLEFYNYYAGQYAILPQINTESLQINTLQVSLWIKISSNSIGTGLEIGVMTDPTNASTFTTVATINNLTEDYQMFDIPLSSYEGEGSYIAFRNSYTGTDYNYANTLIDDITLDIAPQCSRPQNVIINAAQTEATVTWTAENGENFEIYYKPVDSETEEYTLAQATITAGEEDGTWVGVVDELESSTSYMLYVQAICDNESTPQSMVKTFKTTCYAITEFSYSEGFENGLSCWISNPVTGTIEVTTETSYEGGLSAPEGSKFAICKASSRNNITEFLSPEFELSSLDNPTLKFSHIQLEWSGDQDQLYVYYKTSSDAERILLASYTSSITSWTDEEIALPNASDTYQIIFEMRTNYGYGIGIDNIIIGNDGEAPDPVEPTVVTNTATGITQTSATLNGVITDLGNQTITARGFEWKATVGGTYTSVSATGTTMTANLTGLTANTSYTYKAFATTANGTQYGTEVTFTTLEAGEEPCTPATATLNETVCFGETFTFNGNTYTTAGTYTTIVADVNGECDTNYTINLTVNAQNTASETITVCFGETVEFNGQSLTEGENTVTVAGQGSDCDTLYIVTLVVRPENTNAIDVTINPEELPYQFGTQVLEAEGTYTEVFTDENDCDSTVVLTLTVNSSINDVENGINVMLYPNPTTEDAMLRVEGINSDATIYVTDVQGRTIKETKLAQGEQEVRLETSTFARGVYYIRIVTDTINRTEKLIKK